MHGIDDRVIDEVDLGVRSDFAGPFRNSGHARTRTRETMPSTKLSRCESVSAFGGSAESNGASADTRCLDAFLRRRREAVRGRRRGRCSDREGGTMLRRFRFRTAGNDHRTRRHPPGGRDRDRRRLQTREVMASDCFRKAGLFPRRQKQERIQRPASDRKQATLISASPAGFARAWHRPWQMLRYTRFTAEILASTCHFAGILPRWIRRAAGGSRFEHLENSFSTKNEL
mmetsp:Transcript_3928/g.10295  ORF Transcript_3928/g.10295 Transcript_3928/m.10295 type:complete len:229 (+) Transcript_3928:264-950(+)